MSSSHSASNAESGGGGDESGLVIGIAIVAALFLALVIVLIVRTRQHWKQRYQYKMSQTLEQEPYSLATLSRRFSLQSGQDRRRLTESTARSPSDCGTLQSQTNTTQSPSSSGIFRSPSIATSSTPAVRTLPLQTEKHSSNEYSEPLSINHMYGSPLPSNATFPQMRPSISSTSSPCTPCVYDHDSPKSPFAATFHLARPSISSTSSRMTAGYGMLDKTAPHPVNCNKPSNDIENVPYMDMTAGRGGASEQTDYMDMTGENRTDGKHMHVVSMDVTDQVNNGTSEDEDTPLPDQLPPCKQNGTFKQTLSCKSQQDQEGAHSMLASGKEVHMESVKQLEESGPDGAVVTSYQNISTVMKPQIRENIDTRRYIPFPVASIYCEDTDDTAHHACQHVNE